MTRSKAKDTPSEDTTAVAETPQKNLLLEARGAATRQLIAENEDRFNALYVQEAQNRGVVYTPPPSPAQIREQKLRDLMNEDPDLARRVLAEQGISTTGDVAY